MISCAFATCRDASRRELAESRGVDALGDAPEPDRRLSPTGEVASNMALTLAPEPDLRLSSSAASSASDPVRIFTVSEGGNGDRLRPGARFPTPTGVLPDGWLCGRDEDDAEDDAGAPPCCSDRPKSIDHEKNHKHRTEDEKREINNVAAATFERRGNRGDFRGRRWPPQSTRGTVKV